MLYAILGREWVIVKKYRDSLQSCIRLQIGAGICAVPAADAVVTGEVIFYNCVVQLRLLPCFTETIGQGSF